MKHHTNKISILVMIMTILALSAFCFTSITAAPAYKVIGYVYGSPGNIEANKLTHINYAFGAIINGQVTANSGDLAQLVALKQVNPNLKIILSVGGWGAEGFSDAALTDSSRSIFADSCLKVINDNKLDGIDLDWEYPVNGGWGMIKCRPEDKTNFTLLLQAIRNKIGTGKILTIASGASQEYANNTELGKIAQICDYINIMTYDFGASRHNANLYESSFNGSTGVSCDLAVRIHKNSGVPTNKICMGIPFYGRKGSEWPSYAELVANYINKNGYTRYWDDTAKACYLNGPVFITYDDEQSIQCKTDYIKANGLGGAMFWQYAHDPSGTLLTKIWNELNGGVNPTPTPTTTPMVTPTPTTPPTQTPPPGTGIVLSINGAVLSWTDSANGNDYHIYKNGNWLAWTGNHSYTITGAVSGDTFYVTNGSGSVKSNTVTFGNNSTPTPTTTPVITPTPTKTPVVTPTPTPTPTQNGVQPWAPYVNYMIGQLVSYNGKTYECRQAHQSLPGWEPPNVPALWLAK